jgi:hypothetical protein
MESLRRLRKLSLLRGLGPGIAAVAVGWISVYLGSYVASGDLPSTTTDLGIPPSGRTMQTEATPEPELVTSPSPLGEDEPSRPSERSPKRRHLGGTRGTGRENTSVLAGQGQDEALTGPGSDQGASSDGGAGESGTSDDQDATGGPGTTGSGGTGTTGSGGTGTTATGGTGTTGSSTDGGGSTIGSGETGGGAGAAGGGAGSAGGSSAGETGGGGG